MRCCVSMVHLSAVLRVHGTFECGVACPWDLWVRCCVSMGHLSAVLRVMGHLSAVLLVHGTFVCGVACNGRSSDGHMSGVGVKRVNKSRC